MRAIILIASFLPFVYYASRDTMFHFRGRRVSVAEHLIHFAIGVALTVIVVNAVIGRYGQMLVGLALFAIAGALDEYVWHRKLPEEESDLHAKEHLALFLFLVVTLFMNWLESGHSLPTGSV